MRVLQLTSDWKWTGPAEPMLRLGLAQREGGFEVYLACPMAPGPDQRGVSQEAEKAGLVGELESLGGQVIADTCLVVAPVRDLGFRRMATPSGKGAYYAPSHSGLAVHYGPLAACVEAAVSGKWTYEVAD